MSSSSNAADLGLKTTLIERHQTLGGVCLNVGCIPSKALLHAAKIIRDSEEGLVCGIKLGKAQTDLKKLRAWTEQIIGKLTSGLGMLAKQRKVQVLHGSARFTGAHSVELSSADNKKQSISFANAIIATGSRIIHLPIEPDDSRILDSTSALLLEKVPKHMLVLGGGIIGLEMATVYSALGAKITVVEMTGKLLGGADQDLARPLQKRMKAQGVTFMMNTKVEKITAGKQQITVKTDHDSVKCDAVLVAAGRRPDASSLNLQAAGIATDQHGFIPSDDQQRTCSPHIFAIGDISSQPMLAHKAVHEGKLAAEVAAGHKVGFDNRVIPSVAYTDPEVAWAGLTESEAKEKGIKYGKGVFPWAASGRALSLNYPEGSTKLLFDPDSNKLLGIGIVGPSAGDLIAEGVLALETNCDAEDIGLTIHPHPTLSETIGMAAEAFAGTLTDLYLPKKK
ncbi:MAG: dihydrolipoyl dehydrogenase [Candidatus Porifericomitaceae bacterium WSBS_2022_MAG_OTU9]